MAQLTKEQLKKTKIWIGDNPELSKKVQSRLFQLGLKWVSSDGIPRHCNSTALHLWDDGDILYTNDSKERFLKDFTDFKEIHLWDLGLSSTGEYDENIGKVVIIGKRSHNYGQTPGKLGIIKGVNTTYENEYFVHQIGLDETESCYSPYVSYSRSLVKRWLVDEPKEANQFNKGDYIVILYSCDTDGYRTNWVYKQKISSKEIVTELDCKGSTTNGWRRIHFDKKETWRYATAEEIEMYDRAGKPVDTAISKDVPPERWEMYDVLERYGKKCYFIVKMGDTIYTEVAEGGEGVDTKTFNIPSSYIDQNLGYWWCGSKEDYKFVSGNNGIPPVKASPDKAVSIKVPDEWSSLRGKTIKILNRRGADWLTCGEMYKVLMVLGRGTLNLDDRNLASWSCQWSDFEVIEDTKSCHSKAKFLPGDEVSEDVKKEQILIDTKGFEIGDHVLFRDEIVVIQGFNKEGYSAVVEGHSKFNHEGTIRDYWLNRYGESVFHTKKSGSLYYYASLGSLEKVNPSTVSASPYIIGIDPYTAASRRVIPGNIMSTAIKMASKYPIIPDKSVPQDDEDINLIPVPKVPELISFDD